MHSLSERTRQERAPGRSSSCLLNYRSWSAIALVLVVAAQNLTCTLAYIPSEGEEGGAELASGGFPAQVVQLGGLPHAASKTSALAGHLPIATGRSQRATAPKSIGGADWDQEFGPFPMKTNVAKFAYKLQQSASEMPVAAASGTWAQGWGLHPDAPTPASSLHAGAVTAVAPKLDVVPSGKSLAAKSAAPVRNTGVAAKQHVVQQVLRNADKASAAGVSKHLGKYSSVAERSRSHGDDRDSWIAPALTRVMEDDHRWYTGEDIDGTSQDSTIDKSAETDTGRQHVHPIIQQKSGAQVPLDGSTSASHQRRGARGRIVESEPASSAMAAAQHAEGGPLRNKRQHVRGAEEEGQHRVQTAAEGRHRLLRRAVLRKAPIVEDVRNLQDRILGGDSTKKKDEFDDDDMEDMDDFDDDVDDDGNPAEEVKEFETDMKNAFDWNKITFATIPLHQWAWWVASVFVVGTCIVSGQLIWAHLDNYEKPEVQKYVVRIIFMTPIYAIVALLSLTFDNAAPLLNVLRDW